MNFQRVCGIFSCMNGTVKKSSVYIALFVLITFFAFASAVGANTFIFKKTVVEASETETSVAESANFSENASKNNRATDAPRFGNITYDVDFSEGIMLRLNIEVFSDLTKLTTVSGEHVEPGNVTEEESFILTDGSLKPSTEGGSAGVYSLEVCYFDAIIVVARNTAGVESEYSIDLKGFDRQGIIEYYNKFVAVRLERYSVEKGIELNAAFEALEIEFESGGVNENLTAAKRAVDSALSPSISVSVKNLSYSDNIPTGISISPLPFDGCDLIVGAGAALNVDDVNADAETVLERKRVAQELSGYRNAVVAAFSLKLMTGDVENNLTSTAEIGLNLPIFAGIARIYRFEGGTMVPLRAEIEGNRMIFYTDALGEFYLVSERESSSPQADGVTIGGTFIPSSTLWIAGGIVAGVAVLAGGIALTVLIVRNKKSRRY